MDLFSFNDYELIYLIRESNEIALNLLFKKYEPLIYHKMKAFGVKWQFRDEFFSEGLYAIYTAISKFRDDKAASFYKYLDVIITRLFIKKYAECCRYDVPLGIIGDRLNESNASYNKSGLYLYGLCKMTNELEKEIFEDMYVYGLNPADISVKRGIEIKKVYNTVQKIKKLLKN